MAVTAAVEFVLWSWKAGKKQAGSMEKRCQAFFAHELLMKRDWSGPDFLFVGVATGYGDISTKSGVARAVQ